LTDAAHRAHMVELAIRGEPRLALDMREVARAGPSYTIDTLRELRASMDTGQPLVLVIGADQLQRLDTWRDWQSLLTLTHIAVARRAGAPLALGPTMRAYYDSHRAAPAALRERPAGSIADLPMTPVDASATEIRALLGQPSSPQRDATLARLVPAPVLLYIRDAGLYAGPEASSNR
jgi:nicotinate-nucleotide adenylyltransferase